MIQQTERGQSLHIGIAISFTDNEVYCMRKIQQAEATCEKEQPENNRRVFYRIIKQKNEQQTNRQTHSKKYRQEQRKKDIKKEKKKESKA